MSSEHILLIGPAHPYRGGLAAFNERLARELQSNGFQVTLVTFTLQYPGFLFPGKTQFTTASAPTDLNIIRKINSVNPLNWWLVGRELRKLQADIAIFAFWLPFMGPSLGTIARMLGKKTKCIGLVHNIIPHEKRPGDSIFARYFAKAMQGFMTLSDSVAEELCQFSQSPTRTSPHPVYDSYGALQNKEEARKHLGLKKEGKYLLFFGFIRAYKGLDLLLTALADERLAEGEIELIIAGEYYGNQATYEAQIKELGIEERLVMHTHFIPDNEVAPFFGAADVVVQPYKTATQSGISQLAYHFEKPMIVTKVGGLPEIVPDGVAGYVVDTEPLAIADAVVDFYDDDKEQALVEGVRHEKNKYSWSRFVNVMSDLWT